MTPSVLVDQDFRSTWNIFLGLSHSIFLDLVKMNHIFHCGIDFFVSARAVRILDERPLYHEGSEHILSRKHLEVG